jgi:diguanylate cyclase (GGDEF)-like protein
MKDGWEPITSEREKVWLNIASELIPGAIFEYFPEEDVLTYTNYDINGYTQEKRIPACINHFMKHSIHPEDAGELVRLEEQIRKGRQQVLVELRVLDMDADTEKYFHMMIRGYRVYDKGKKKYKICGVFANVDINKKYFETKRDPATYFWNRRACKEYIGQYLTQEQAKGKQAKGTFYLIQIGNLRQIIDSMGNLFGDYAIVSVSRAIRDAFYHLDILGRISLDEFVVFVRGGNTSEEVMCKSVDLRRAVSRIYCGERAKAVTVYIGVVQFPDDTTDMRELYLKASVALKEAVLHPGNPYSSFGAIQNPQEFSKAELEKDEEELEIIGTQVKRLGKYCDFYNEITELVLGLMDESKDMESAVLLLLHKVKNKFHFDAVSVLEIVEKEERCLKYTFEASEPFLPTRVGSLRKYTESEWMTFQYAMEEGKYLYNPEPYIADLFFSDHKLKAALRLPLDGRKYFTGVVDFICAAQDHYWEEDEVQCLEAFCRILSIYLKRIRNLDEAHFLATMMQERDSVTGLYSYGKFLDKLREATVSGKAPYGVLYVYSDISHFKYINETYGYDIGDRLLRRFAEFLMDNKGSQILGGARVHSDNIVAALAIDKDITVETLAEIVDWQNEEATKLLREYVHDNMVEICSGLFLCNDPQLSVEEAVSNAEYACKEGKKENWKKCKIFTNEMLIDYKRQMGFIKELRGAIENRELQVYVQPKMLADGESVAGGEALIRWIKPNKEMIFPDEFIPPFEKSGAILDVDFFVYREVFSYLRRRIDQNLPVVPISMNVSRVHINNDRMIDYIKELFQEYQIDPNLVEFELTESIYIENLEKAVALISKIREMGVKVSMDDFGSGYSSLNMLSNMPMDIMKIDRIFLKGDTPNESDKIILNGIIYMGRELNMCMVCEGVETKEQYEFLREIGCDMMQGYYFGKPMPLDDFDRFLENRKVRHYEKRKKAQTA